MIVLLAALAFAAPDSLDLGTPNDHDGLTDIAYDASGTGLVCFHDDTDSLTRVEIATGALTAAVHLPHTANTLGVDDTGAHVVAYDRRNSPSYQWGTRVSVLASADLTVVATFDTGLVVREVSFDDTTGRALVVGHVTPPSVTETWQIWDTTTATLLRTHQVEQTREAWIGPGAQAVNVIQSFVPPPPHTPDTRMILRRFDVLTGALEFERDIPVVSYAGWIDTYRSRDRSSVVFSDVAPGPDERYRSFDFASDVLTERRVPGIGNIARTGVRTVSDDGLTVVTVNAQRLELVGTNPPVFLGAPSPPVDGGRWYLGNADLTEVAVFPGTSPVTVWKDVNAGTSTELLCPDRFAELARLGPGSTVAVVQAGCDLVHVLDPTQPTEPRILRTSPADDVDGPFLTVPLDGQPAALVLATTSGHAFWIGRAPVRITGRLSLGAALTSATRVDGGDVWVGTLEGEVLVLDAESPTLRARHDLPGIPRELDGAGPDLFARARVGPTGDQLLRIRTSDGAVTASEPLGPAVVQDARDLPFGLRTVVVDQARQLAFAWSRVDRGLEVLDLATGVRTPAPTSFEAGVASLTHDAAAQRVFVKIAPGTTLAFDVSGPSVALLWDAYPEVLSGTPECEPDPYASVGGSNRTRAVHDPATDIVLSDTYCAVDLFGGGPFGICNEETIGLGVAVLDASTGTVLGVVPDVRSTGLAADAGIAVTNVAGLLEVIRTDGAALATREWLALVPETAPGVPTLLGELGLCVVPLERDGSHPPRIEVLDLVADRSVDLCTANPANATGVQTRLELFGTTFHDQGLRLRASGLAPGGMFGLLLASPVISPPYPIWNGRGQLCLSYFDTERFNARLQPADAAGEQWFDLAPNELMGPSGATVAMRGTSVGYQVWHRDLDPSGSPSSNASNAVRLVFR